MFVDPALLDCGAQDSHSAAAHAHAGAARLSQLSVAGGVFGSFAAADVFHRALSTAHADHIGALHGHRRALSDVADKAQQARRAFLDMDEHNATELSAVRCSFAT